MLRFHVVYLIMARILRARTSSMKTSLHGTNTVIPCVLLLLSTTEHIFPSFLSSRDYNEDDTLDRYSADGIDDDGPDEGPTIEQRRAADRAIDRRNAGGGRRGAGRIRGLDEIVGDSESNPPSEGEGGTAGIIPATVQLRYRRNYDERRDLDDADGIDDDEELPLEHLSDIKANSVSEWIAQPRVRKTIEKHFRDFLVTYTDAQGRSVYGPRIKSLGERKLATLPGAL